MSEKSVTVSEDHLTLTNHLMIEKKEAKEGKKARGRGGERGREDGRWGRKARAAEPGGRQSCGPRKRWAAAPRASFLRARKPVLQRLGSDCSLHIFMPLKNKHFF